MKAGENNRPKVGTTQLNRPRKQPTNYGDIQNGMKFLFFDVRDSSRRWESGAHAPSCVSHLVRSAELGRTMAAGCCGTKKQKLNNSSGISSCNGTSMLTNGVSNGMVALPEMCFFCFDVLYSHLYNLDPPKTPSFSNDA